MNRSSSRKLKVNHFEGCKFEDLDDVKSLMKEGADVNAVDERVNLFEACKLGDLDAVKSLVEEGSDVNAVDERRLTCLEYASRRGRRRIVNFLLSVGVNINNEREDGNTTGGSALAEAASKGFTKIVKTLITEGIDIHKELKDGNTTGGKAFEMVPYSGNLHVLKTLIDAGVDIHKQLKDGSTTGENTFELAGYCGKLNVLTTLIDAGVNIHKELEDGYTTGGKVLIEAANAGSMGIVNTLIASGVNIHKEREDGTTTGGRAMAEAAAWGFIDIINTLITKGVDINKEGGQALKIAVENGHLVIVDLLIKAGVDIAKEGGHALEIAIKKGHLMIVDLLIKAGVDIAKEGGQALKRAIKKGHLVIVSKLIKVGVDITKVDISECKKSLKWLRGSHDVNSYDIVVRYKIYEIISQKTKGSIIRKMKADMEKIQDEKVLRKYRRAIKDYESDLPGIKTGVTLTDAELVQFARIFADGAEKDFTVRINFVGFTGAGKTSLMYQMFLKIFSPKDIESTNLIDISIGYCNIDINTGQWRRHNKSEDETFLQRVKTLTIQNIDQSRPYEKRKLERLLPGPNKTKDFETTDLPVTKMKSENKQTIPIPTEVKTILCKPSSRKEQFDEYLSERIEKASLRSGRKSDEANANGIEYAGQSTYYALHQLFMSERGVNLIVLDGSMDFSDLIPDDDFRHIGIKKGGNTLDFFRYWSNLLRYYLPNRRGKHIITVFTHKDLIQSEEKLEDRKSVIKEIILQMGMKDTFCDRIYCINTNDPNDKELQELRQVILEFSRQEDEWGQEMSSTFLLLEDKLMNKKRSGHKVMTLDEVECLNAESCPKIQSRDDLLLFLKIHHEVGTLMHFAKEGILKIVILNPQWLIDSLKAIICSRRFRNVQYHKEWDRLNKKGIVDKKFMYRVWEEKKEDRFFEFREQLVKLMNNLDLISSPKVYNEDGKHASSAYFIVPCMLQNAPKNFLQEFCTNVSHTNSPLKFEFEHQFLPSATVYRLLATCVKEYGEMQKKDSIFCDVAAFKVGKVSYLTLEFSTSSIIANVVTIGLDNGDVGLSQGLREFLDYTLQCIIASQKTTTSYTLLVACGNTGNDGHSWISWQDILNNSEFSCDRHKNDPPHYVKCKAILQQWSVEHANEPRHTERFSTDDVQPFMENKPQQLFLGRISRIIPATDCNALFIELGLKSIVIDDIKQAPYRDMTRTILLLLIEWSRRADTSYQQLADALEKQHNFTLNLEVIRHPCCEWRKGVSKVALQKPLSEATDKEKDTIITYVGAKYLELGLELGLIKEQVDAFREDLRSCHEITRHILKLWIADRRAEATWKVLGDTLYEIRCDPTFIKQVCQAKYSIQS